jgi:hypothetical protein
MRRTLKLMLILPLLLAGLTLAGACDNDVTTTGGEPELYLRVSPLEVLPGQDIEIEVQFYPEGEMELVLWVEGEGYGPFYTDAAGYFYGTYTVDPFAPAGEYMLTVELTGPGMQASEYYTVVTEGMAVAPPPAMDAEPAEYTRCDITVTGAECGAEVSGVTGGFSGNTFSGEVSYDLNERAHVTQSVTVVLDESLSMVQDFQLVEVIRYDPPEESWRSDMSKRQTTVIGNDIPLASAGSSGVFGDALAFGVGGPEVIRHISMSEFLVEYYSGDREVETMDNCGFGEAAAGISIVLY